MISALVIIKKNIPVGYTFAYRSNNVKLLLDFFSFIVVDNPNNLQTFQDFLAQDKQPIMNFSPFLVKLVNSNSILLSRKRDDKKDEITIEKKNLINILQQWNELDIQQPQEIIITQNNSTLDFKGTLTPIEKKPEPPHLVLVKKNQDYVPVASEEDWRKFDFIHSSISEFTKNKEIFKRLIYLLKEKNNFYEFHHYFHIKINKEEVSINETDLFDLWEYKEHKVNKKTLLNLLIKLDKAISKDPESIKISLIDTTYIVEASFEPYTN